MSRVKPPEKSVWGCLWKLMFLLGLMALIVFGPKIMPDVNKATEISAAQLYAAIEEGRVKEMDIYPDSGKAEGVFTDGKEFVTLVASVEELEKRLIAKKVGYRVVKTSTFEIFLLTTLVPILLFALLIYFFFIRPMLTQARNGNGPLGQLDYFRKSKLEFVDPRKIKEDLDDVIGADEAKKKMKNIIRYLQNPDVYAKFNISSPRGVLMIGPPGCGKTMLARAVAKKAGASFASISGSDFVEMLVGVGAARIKDMFKQAREAVQYYGACIIFIDEIDALGKRRGSGSMGNHDEHEQTLNALLAEMDGFEARDNIIVIGATNRSDVLDEALIRPGRFDYKVIMGIPPPDLGEREEILKVHSRGKPMAEGVDLKEIARATTGFSGAELEKVIKGAVELAIEKEKGEFDQQELREALDDQIMGGARKGLISPDEKNSVAYHEAGHTLAVMYSPNAEPLYKVTILPRGLSLGATYQLPQYDRNIVTKEYLTAQIVVAMGGRAAEMLKFNRMSTGARSDFAHATRVAADMVYKYGMDEAIGPMVFGSIGNWFGAERIDCSDEMRWRIETRVKAILEGCYQQAVDILKERVHQLDALAKALVEKEKLDAEEIEQILKNCNKSAS